MPIIIRNSIHLTVARPRLGVKTNDTMFNVAVVYTKSTDARRSLKGERRYLRSSAVDLFFFYLLFDLRVESCDAHIRMGREVKRWKELSSIACYFTVTNY